MSNFNVYIFFISHYKISSDHHSFEWSSYNEKKEHISFQTYESILKNDDFARILTSVLSPLCDIVFMLFPMGCDTIPEFVELLLGVCVQTAHVREVMQLDPILWKEFYMVINFLVRYTVGKRRSSDSTKSRGPVFWVRYKEVLPTALKLKITKCFKKFINQNVHHAQTKTYLDEMFKSISCMGRTIDFDKPGTDSGLSKIFDLGKDGSNFNPLYFTRILTFENESVYKFGYDPIEKGLDVDFSDPPTYWGMNLVDAAWNVRFSMTNGSRTNIVWNEKLQFALNRGIVNLVDTWASKYFL